MCSSEALKRNRSKPRSPYKPSEEQNLNKNFQQKIQFYLFKCSARFEINGLFPISGKKNMSRLMPEHLCRRMRQKWRKPLGEAGILSEDVPLVDFQVLCNLLECQMTVNVGGSGLCCCVPSIERYSVGTCQETSSNATRQGTLGHSRPSWLSHCGLILA